ncbi:MAG: glycosyl transferase family 1 [Candidatus Riflebacteria bacterium HGW-Riflebacteria-1]|jgi:glycosyltransferase involved in cell wall biosynthesis|nr:MAG: glycosyl transferase family 1 [Candidatus Riflebacteria bacterium HGW-Riflebacteria-1]
MKILLVNYSDTSGGAARATFRLHKGLQSEGVLSELLVQEKNSDDYTVAVTASKFFQYFPNIMPIIDSLPLRLYPKRKKLLLFSPSWFSLNNFTRQINESDADLVHLHWICGGLLTIEDLAKIKKPIVWSLHDDWAFTGGCHVKWECEKYKEKCGFCPNLSSKSDKDLSRRGWKRKKNTYEKLSNLVIVGPSLWLQNCAKESSLFHSFKTVSLPNPINTNIFKPISRQVARELWSLPLNKRIVLFGAMNAASDPNKGFNFLREALLCLKSKNIELVVFGSSKTKESPDFGFPVHYVGRLYDDISLRALYSAADVMVVPSLQEAFGQTASESMACGTPVVGFGATGLLDIIDHKINGYLARPYLAGDLAQGIEWILNSPHYSGLCQAAREKIVNCFDTNVVVRKYIMLYEEVLLNEKKRFDV